MLRQARGRVVRRLGIGQIVEQGLHGRGVLGCPFGDPQHVFVSLVVDPDRRDQEVVADFQTVDLHHQQVERREVRAEPGLQLLAGQRDEAARDRRLRGRVRLDRRQIARRQPHGPTVLAGRDVQHHQVHRPGPRRIRVRQGLPARQLHLLAGQIAHPRADDLDLAALPGKLAVGRAPTSTNGRSGYSWSWRRSPFWIKHPEPNGSRRTTPTSLFQHLTGHPLQNYMTYKAYYQLEKAIEDDSELNGRRGQRKVARFASLHPTAIGQKVEVIIEHFRRHVLRELDGEAKAMIVTQSREHALRYFFGVRDYIKAEGYTDLKALVAFSGDLTVDGETYTEAELNGFSKTELPGRFSGFKPDGTAYPDQYQILIVAEKYQTGFDQPKLCAMYVDRKLAGLQAVQTLSRLNRMMPGKSTYILDFQNTIEDIQTAFRPFYEVTDLEAMSDPNQVYELEGRLFKFGILDRDEIERFAETYYKGPLDGADRARLEGLVRQAVSRFEAEDDEGKQEEFRQLVRSYMRFYSFVAQVIRLEDTGLEKLYTYAYWLSRLLPNREIPPDIEITDYMLRLQAFKVVEKKKGSASLSPGDTERLKAISEFGAKPYTEDEKKELSEIVKAFNERHGTNFNEADMIRFEQVNQEILTEDMTEMLRNNPPDVVYAAFRDAFFQGAIRMFQRDNEMRNIVLTDAEARDKATRNFFNRALQEVREEA